ncbi:unnamed protein product [Symbiodinium microadriaticum]|nr:unnamed protein product [Symbiodinium microadriaticum]
MKAEDFPGRYVPEPLHPDDDDFIIRLNGEPRDYEFGDYGRGKFTCASPEAKLRYLSVFLKDRLFEALPANIAKLVMDSWVGEDAWQESDYVDHQSWYFLPSEFGEEVPDEQFFMELKDFFMKENLAILGDCDESEENHPLANGSEFRLPIPLEPGWDSKIVCRKDEQYNYWTVFCQEDGTKLRFRLGDDPEKFNEVPKKASAPELIDIKITDYCPFGCAFCYQSSTKEGKHAQEWEVKHFSDFLKEIKVFEVAFGGGEPTMHPNFANILKAYRQNGIVPNFTTKNTSWLRDSAVWQPIIEECGAFAYSASDDKEITNLGHLLGYNNIPSHKTNIHLVMGTISQWQFKRMLKACFQNHFRVTLLGYKDFGFGQNFHKQEYDWWVSALKEVAKPFGWGYGVSVDTVLAAEYEDKLKEEEIPDWMYDTKDGSFSCYVDLVSQKIGPNSYCSEEEMYSINPSDNENEYDMGKLVLRNFQRWVYWHANLPIYVIDVSNTKNFWGDYPRQFDFEVIQQKSVYADIERQESELFGPVSHELLGKTNDVWHFSSRLNFDYYAVLDSDLFWVKHPLPFYGSGSEDFWIAKDANTGFYYYHKDACDFIYLWRGLNNLAVWEEKFRRRVCEFTGYDTIQEEAVCSYAVKKFGNCNFKRYPTSENFATSCYGFRKKHDEAKDAKVLHILSKNCKDKNNLAVANSIIEVREMMQRMFSEEQHQEIFPESLGDVSYKNPHDMKRILTL